MNAAIITARGGSKSILDKNVFPVLGEPMVSYPIKAASGANKVDNVFISTDCVKIINVAKVLGCHVIERPEELCGDHVNHGDVIKHAVEYVQLIDPQLTNVAILLGNTVMFDSELLDRAFDILEKHPEYDSVMSVWEAADDHPLRALRIEDGFLAPYAPRGENVSTERQSYPKAYYYDQGVWVFRKECVQRKDGPSPWWWMGKKAVPIIRNWITGRDIHTHLDVGIAEWWIKHYPEVKGL